MALVLNLPSLAGFVQPPLGASSLPRPVRCSAARFGRAYVAHAFPEPLPDADGAKSTADEAGSAARTGRRDMGDRKKNVKLDDADLEVDWYGLLKLPNAEGSTDEEIRGAYRRRCLETHPDKQPDGSDLEFKRVQRAFEILGNPEARRSYDSSRPFDDAIPGETVAEDAFFTTFGPVFERNKKWSAEQEMPSLGEPSTAVNDVRKFYDAWLAFRSWRDFSNEVELQEIDEGMMREEKRYYQRENQRLLDKLNRDELKRVRTLVDRAMKNDPRLRRAREAEEASRQEALAQRQAQREAAEADARRAKDAAEAAEKAAAEEKKKSDLNQKNRLRNAVKDIADFAKENNLIDNLETNKLLACKIRKPNVQWIMQNGTIEEVEQIRDAVLAASTSPVQQPPPPNNCEEQDSAKHVPAVVAFNEGLHAIEQRVRRTRYGEGIKQAASPSTASPTTAQPAPAKAKAKFTDDDMILLQKLAIKFPGGCVDRWRHIATSMHNKFTEEQILEQVKLIESGWKSGAKPPSAASAGVPDAPSAPVEEEWTPNQQRQLETGLRELQAYKEKDKFTKIAAYVEGKNAKQCFERFKFLCAMRKGAQ